MRTPPVSDQERGEGAAAGPWAELGHDAELGRVYDAADRPTKPRRRAGRITGFQAAR
jgi:hypothetical protein